ncbi:COP9 signalosome complex subunit 4 [Diplonema papillatum]|nr:COP9 signalosome complex subunit 4 [Diplonema papillatum]
MSASLKEILQAPGDAPEKAEKLKEWIARHVEKADVAALGHFIPELLDESVPLSLSRPAISEWAGSVLDIPESRGVENEDPKLPHDDMVALGSAAVDLIAPRSSAFQEQVLILHDCLSWVYQDRQDWRQAVDVLRKILQDSALVADKGDQFKVELFIRISRLYVENKDYYEADVWINKAWPLMTSAMDNTLQLQFNGCFARVNDGKRKFFDAARKYYELSHLVSGDEQAYSLKQAIVCVMLSDAGPQRSRLLAALYKDDRTQELEELYRILQKMLLDRLLRREDIDEVRPHLMPHHETITEDGSTVLQRAVTQHNLRSASKLYNNIMFDELAVLLDIPSSKAQRVAAKMIGEGRLSGTVCPLVLFFARRHTPRERRRKKKASLTRLVSGEKKRKENWCGRCSHDQRWVLDMFFP